MKTRAVTLPVLAISTLFFFATVDCVIDAGGEDPGEEEVDAGELDAGEPDAAQPDPCLDYEALRSDAIENGSQVLNGITLSASTPITDILADQPTYANQLVQIEGRVVDMCSSQGCWAGLVDPMGLMLLLKVTDGLLDFRLATQRGRYMVGEGVFTTDGEHGAMVVIDGYGAMSGTVDCSHL